jgi:hypothetical protein
MGDSEGTRCFAESTRDKTENIKIRAREKIPSPPKGKELIEMKNYRIQET